MVRLLCVVTAMLVLACAQPVPVLGGLTLRAGEHDFAVQAHGASLLEASTAVAPVATRVGRARYEMQYGSWRITDDQPAWTEATRFSWSAVSAAAAEGTWADAAGHPVARLSARADAEGELAMTFTAADPATNRLSLAFTCADADRFLGFGGQSDALDHHGHRVAVWVSEPGIGKQITDDEYPDVWFLVGTRHASSFGLPTWTSNRGYQGLAQSDARTIFEVCSARSDVFRIEVWSNTVTLWVFEGAPAPALTRATHAVLGRPRQPPPVAFAPWNDAIFGPAEVRRVASLLRDNHIPSSALWTEDFRGGTDEPSGYRLVEEWDIDRTLYPGAEALAAELQDGGFSWQAYFNTFVVGGTRVAAEAVDGGHLVGSPDGGAYSFSGVTFEPTGLADLSRPQTREWVAGFLRRALDVGFTGWMADFGEWLPHDAVLASGEDPLLAHNRYPLEWARLNQQVLDERAGDGRQRLFFARAGWLGSNAVTPVVWAGDQRTSFQSDDGLPTVIPIGLNLGLAGVSLYAHDIAGYQSATNPPSTKELFFRWASLGALTPVMRTHHGVDARHNWKFDSDAETLAHYRRWARFHIQLYPYLDAASSQAEATGVPIVRALPLMVPEDSRGWTIADQYFLGPTLLVAPVVQEGATARSVYLPDGDWVSWDGLTRAHGPSDLMVPAPMGELPVFLRAGACVPRLPERVETLLDAAPPVVDLHDVALERSLLVVAGGASDLSERDGTRYQVSAGAQSAFAEAGAALPDCASAAQRGCVDRTGPNPVARLAGSGPLDFPGGALTITASVARAFDVEVLLAR